MCAHNEMAPCQAEARALRDQYDAKDREVKATKTQVMYACARGSLVIHLLCIHDHSTAHAVAHAPQIEAVKVTETPVKNVEKKVRRSVRELDGLELILLPLLYLEDFTKRLINNQF